MMKSNILLIFVIVLITCLKVESQFTVYPSILYKGILTPITLKGTFSFGTQPTVKFGAIDGEIVSYTTTEVIIRPANIDSVTLPSVTITLSGYTPITIPTIYYTGYSQIDQYLYLIGDFQSIQSKSLYAYSLNQQTQIPCVYFNATSCFYEIVQDIISSTAPTLFVDRSTGVEVFRTTILIGPIVEKVIATGNQIIIQGFNLSPLNYVNINSVKCDIELSSDVQVVCNPIQSFYFDKITSYTVDVGLTIPSSPITSVSYQRGVLESFTSLSDGSTISISNFDESQHVFSNLFIVGLENSLPVTFSISSEIEVTFTKDATCGYVYLVDTTDPNAVVRLSNSMLLCPKEVVTNVGIPQNTDGVLYITGNYLSPNIYGTTEKRFSYYIDKDTGSETIQLSSISMTGNGIYTLVFPIPQGPIPFLLKMQSTGGTSTSSLIRYAPTIISVTETSYNIPSNVTITGTGFYNSQCQVFIGNSQCKNVQVLDLTTLTCLFASNVLPVDNKRIAVSVSFQNIYNGLNYIFEYKCSNPCVYGTCSPLENTCVCEGDWIGPSCSHLAPKIDRISSTKYGTPGKVTIDGDNFANVNLQVAIGGSICGDPLASQDTKSITCLFKSDVIVSDSNQALDVLVSVDSIAITKEKIFLYIKPEKQCPIGSNGQVCSGHGNCNQQQFTCDCNKDWESLDCSLPNLGGSLTPPV
ncbi:hypothetical protein CYY_010502, partial [Polysphondylium violaceum]